MAPTTLKSKLEYDDLAALPHDNQRYELLEGVLYLTPSPNTIHQRASKRLQRQLEAYFEPRGLGEVFDAPTDLILSRHDVVVPDLVVAAPAQIATRGIEGAPLFVVEIESPSSVEMDRELKPARFVRFQVPHYWLVDPGRRVIDCFTLNGDRYELVASIGERDRYSPPDWPGLEIDAAAIWAR
jgi:Uma2 family endonuclease